MTIYLELTREFNKGRLRAVLCSGQAVVLHRLAIQSKDGDWILREDDEALAHVLRVLGERGAHYRFGAPLDVRWLSGGWSSHFEFLQGELRIRTDFFTRPPRVSERELARMWTEQEGRDPPFTDLRMTAEMKKTEREKDYPFLGELARRMESARDQLFYSRSAGDLIELAALHPEIVGLVAKERPVLSQIGAGRRELAEALLREQLDLMELDERRLRAYRQASRDWAAIWIERSREIETLPLGEAHRRLVEAALQRLPMRVPRASS